MPAQEKKLFWRKSMTSRAAGLKPCKVDEVDEQILDILAFQAKTTHQDIARQLKLDESDVTKRIDRLEKEGVIIGYRAHINWQRVRQNHVSALIEVKVSPERNVGFDAVAEAIYKFPEVSSLSLLSGGYDLLVQIEGDNLREVALFVAEKLAPISGVQSTVSHFLLKTYKEDGVMLVEPGGNNRLPVAP